MKNSITNTAIKHKMVYHIYPDLKVGTARLIEPCIADFIYNVGKL